MSDNLFRSTQSSIQILVLRYFTETSVLLQFLDSSRRHQFSGSSQILHEDISSTVVLRQLAETSVSGSSQIVHKDIISLVVLRQYTETSVSGSSQIVYEDISSPVVLRQFTKTSFLLQFLDSSQRHHLSCSSQIVYGDISSPVLLRQFTETSVLRQFLDNLRRHQFYRDPKEHVNLVAQSAPNF